MIIDKVLNTTIISGVNHHWVDLLLVSPTIPAHTILIWTWAVFNIRCVILYPLYKVLLDTTDSQELKQVSDD
jgi:hypothetical protein